MRKIGRGEVVRIGSLFDHYKKRFTAPERTVVLACIEVLKELFSFQLKENQCRYAPRSRTITLIVSGPLKTEIQLQKEKVLTGIRERVGEKNAPIHLL